jgi:hypothetical protein
MKRPRFIDVIRLGEVLAPIIRELLRADKGDKLILTVKLRRAGDKPWQLKLDGPPQVDTIDNTERIEVT